MVWRVESCWLAEYLTQQNQFGLEERAGGKKDARKIFSLIPPPKAMRTTRGYMTLVGSGVISLISVVGVHY